MTDNDNSENNQRALSDPDDSLEEVIKKDETETTFQDLPTDVIKEILDKLTLVESILVSDVCQMFRDYVTKRCPRFDEIEFVLDLDAATLSFSSYSDIKYKETCEETIIEMFNEKKIKLDNDHFNYLETCINHFGFFLKNAKPKTMIIYNSGCILDTFTELTKTLFQSMFESIGNRIDVEEVCFQDTSFEMILTVLPHINENSLRKIDIDFFDFDEESEDDKQNFQLIKELEQWKKTKEIALRGPEDLFEISDVIEKEKFEIWWCLSLQEVIPIIQTVSQSSIFESAFILVDDGVDGEGLKDGLDGCIDGSEPETIFYQIPGCDEFLEIKPDRHGIMITKKTCML